MQTKMVSLLYIGTHGKLHGLELILIDQVGHGEDVAVVKVDNQRRTVNTTTTTNYKTDKNRY